MKREILGDSHPHVALIEYDLALVLWKKFKVEDAMFLLQDAQQIFRVCACHDKALVSVEWSIFQDSIGPNHPFTETISSTLADVEKQVNLAIEAMNRQKAEAGPDLSILSEDEPK